MQIALFPNQAASSEPSVTFRTSRVGPIRFAATRTSFPHLHEVLAQLTAGADQPLSDDDPPGQGHSASPLG